jgi:shikimate dehydrogenase
VGLLGWPVEDSLSPLIHNVAFAALGLDWAYVPLPVPPGRLPAAVAGLEAMGFAGANVTMPHKAEAASLAASLTDDAARLGAVNTLVATPRGMAGHNTDAPGFARFLEADAGFDPAGGSALIFGAGGAARACALTLARAGVRTLTVCVRNPAGADGLVTSLRGLPVEVTVEGLDAARHAAPDVLVNATPVGRSGETLPHPPLRPGMLVLDLLYRPPVTRLLDAARAAGAAAFGGLGLLLHQAALSFELWTGQAPPMAAMSAAAMAELSESAH